MNISFCLFNICIIKLPLCIQYTKTLFGVCVLKSVLKVTFAYLAAVIGAGFASGSEVVLYFIRYGKISIIGIALTAVGFGLVIYNVLVACLCNNINSFESLAKRFLTQKQASIINIIMVVFMVIMIGAMISAFSEMVWQLFEINKRISSVIFALVCAYVIVLPGESIIKWGGYIGLFIVVFICLSCVYMINFRTVKVFSPMTSMSLSAGVYTAYNAFAVLPVVCKASECMKTKKECRQAGMLSALFSFLSLLLIWSLIMIYYGKIDLGAMPMLTLAARQGTWFKNLYAVIVIAAVLSSAVANSYGIYLKLDKTLKTSYKKIILSILPGWLVASMSFTYIVDKLYRIIGFISIVIIGYILIKIKKNDDNQRK